MYLHIYIFVFIYIYIRIHTCINKSGKKMSGKLIFTNLKKRLGKTGVTADRDKIEFRLFNSSSIFNITLR